LGNLLRNEPDRDEAETADRVTEDVLRLFGLSAARYPISTASVNPTRPHEAVTPRLQ
jgi:hypothetical protein